MLFVLLIGFSSHLKFQGGCALKCQKAPLLASNIPLLLFSLKAFPKPWKFSQPVIGLNMKGQGSYYNPHPMGDGSPWPSILPTDNSEVHPSWSLAGSIQLLTGVIRSIMYLFLKKKNNFCCFWSPFPCTLLLPGITSQTNYLHPSLCLTLFLNKVMTLEDAKKLTHSSEHR